MPDSFCGLVELEDSLHIGVQVVNTSLLPVQADALPTFRVFGLSGLLTNASGVATQKQTGTITGATNATPIVITSVGHNLQTGMRVTITGVGGNGAANSTWTITRVSADTFSLDTSVGNGAYTSGGTWVVSGFYDLSIPATAAHGFDAGISFTVHCSYEISAVGYAQVFSFTTT